MKIRSIGGLVLLLSAVSLQNALAQEGGDFATAITSGKAAVGVRGRYEFVDQDNVSKEANALTARVRLNYGTGNWNDWSAFAEFDHVFHLVDDFNSGAGTSPNRTQYPVVADPDGSDLNQLYVDYSGSEDWSLRLGRQRILLDDQRFVGGVGWRQNEQTYDAATLTTSAIQRTKLQYSYVDSVRRIFGDEVSAGKNDTNIHLLNAKITLDERWSVTPYFYYIKNKDVAAFSTQTIGARVAGSVDAGDGKLAIVGELATQSDASNNPVNYDATFVRIDATWALKNGVSLGLAYESLGGDENNAGAAFRTPLATLHKFQGWADKFLATPAAGIDDIYATVKYTAGAWKLAGTYHDFSAESGGGDFGSEFDISASRTFNQRYGLLLKAAFFSGDDPAFPDTTKLWVQLTASY